MKNHILLTRADLKDMLRHLDDYESRLAEGNCIIVYLHPSDDKRFHSWCMGSDDRLPNAFNYRTLNPGEMVNPGDQWSGDGKNWKYATETTGTPAPAHSTMFYRRGVAPCVKEV